MDRVDPLTGAAPRRWRAGRALLRSALFLPCAVAAGWAGFASTGGAPAWLYKLAFVVFLGLFLQALVSDLAGRSPRADPRVRAEPSEQLHRRALSGHRGEGSLP